MRPILFLPVVAALISAPAASQSVIPPLDVARAAGPNALAIQRPPGPNARAAERPVGPNGAVARERGRVEARVDYPSCAAAGTVRPVPLRRGEPGYGRHLDSDGDGVACD
jgi:hypothetical protein